ncbi:hypothetical protein SARC_06407 [Sphaeroforma arctica JP610]|uniref:Saposin A-type domain-containing protein n=1 Tax=Sphaeroforma arctica JP610 TaxID=667725 RepID=A0A0L0FXI1_9EUKA|nr:hypothetical protein SARC_06407 [Sphaeroforma arctica JP610]KNC81261.1 hypothetical protein SARC_06407 [Sphaeroforma arctica JP610]|eukprot:XP_014155163.1 hypothetical protein SARC_06407 [Sphaeroforma arctica JP610]
MHYPASVIIAAAVAANALSIQDLMGALVRSERQTDDNYCEFGMSYICDSTKNALECEYETYPFDECNEYCARVSDLPFCVYDSVEGPITVVSELENEMAAVSENEAAHDGDLPESSDYTETDLNIDANELEENEPLLSDEFSMPEESDILEAIDISDLEDIDVEEGMENGGNADESTKAAEDVVEGIQQSTTDTEASTSTELDVPELSENLPILPAQESETMNASESMEVGMSAETPAESIDESGNSDMEMSTGMTAMSEAETDDLFLVTVYNALESSALSTSMEMSTEGETETHILSPIEKAVGISDGGDNQETFSGNVVDEGVVNEEVSTHRCFEGPSFYCASFANAELCGYTVENCSLYCNPGWYPELSKGEVCV